MTTTQYSEELQDKIAQYVSSLVDQMGPDLVENPALADLISQQFESLLAAAAAQDAASPRPRDGGLAQLVGVGDESAEKLGETRMPLAVERYDDQVPSERIMATGDLYYIYKHESLGVFRAVLELQKAFNAGTLRLAEGDGAYKIFQFDRRKVLRATHTERNQTYQRVFGYTRVKAPLGAQPNRMFHTLMTQFMVQVAQFFRDKRISEVVRPRVTDLSFGSQAIVRRAGLDLRNNMKNASYGNPAVLRVELLQLLEDAFRIFSSPDVKKQFGADTSWDVLEEVMRRYMGRSHIPASQHSRMADAGRQVIYWLAQPHILNSTRAEFEALLTTIAGHAEEWLMSAQTLRDPRFTQRRSYTASGQFSALPSQSDWSLESE